jgi:hypothetical protein
MKRITLRASVVAGLLLLGGILPSQATPLTWTLSGVTFDDGTMATGYFEFDASTHTSSSFNISTTEGALSAHTYDTGNSSLIWNGRWNMLNFFDSADDRYISFWLGQALTDAGGTVNILDYGWGYECYNCEPVRWMVAGSLTSQPDADVPEPGSLAMVLPALGMLGFMARRRRILAA